MTQSEAKSFAEKRLAEIQKDCPVDISLNDKLTEEHLVGFVFFYNSTKYWESQDFMDALAGNGPILVKKNSGEVIALPSNQSVEQSLREMIAS